LAETDTDPDRQAMDADPGLDPRRNDADPTGSGSKTLIEISHNFVVLQDGYGAASVPVLLTVWC
jgi:hypothetical protein